MFNLNYKNRVCEERNCKVGEEVGYVVRFDNCTSSKTKIKVWNIFLLKIFSIWLMVV